MSGDNRMGSLSEPWAYSQPDAVALAREEGRREVLALIAALPQPIASGFPFGVEPMLINRVHHCLWCDEGAVRAAKTYEPVNHRPDCLWLRASNALKETP